MKAIADLKRFRITLDNSGHCGAIRSDLVNTFARSYEAGQWYRTGWALIREALRDVAKGTCGQDYAEYAADLANRLRELGKGMPRV